MKQLILPFNTGKPELLEVPVPTPIEGELLIQNVASVVSTGTERMLLEFGQAGWLGKLRQQPEKARQVLQKIKTDGVAPTIKAVRSKLDTPIPLGYSSAGIVLAVGPGITDIRPGDRVASNGPHAEAVAVPRNLVAKIPDNVSDEAAAFTVLGAIALQGIRIVAPTFGETVVVVGLGLIGQLTAQLLLANGCRVIGTDLSKDRMALAAQFGVQSLTEASGDAVRALTDGYGADAVIITASGGEGLLDLAADMSRKRGRIVLTGVTDMQLGRDAFFRKELSFQVSSSYGPGRYERAYEQGGLDYPLAYVRWTEGRNLEAVLSAMSRGQLHTAPLITSRSAFDDAPAAYDRLDDPSSHMATVFRYKASSPENPFFSPKPTAATQGGVAVIGAGAFAGSVLIPGLKKAGANITGIVSRNGLSAATQAKKHGIAQAGTSPEETIGNPDVAAVVIATPHSSHASLAAAALISGKAVFVEKPLALDRRQLQEVSEALTASKGTLTVGFNRRKAPLAAHAQELLQRLGGPTNIIITINAGSIPASHWAADPATGGGRIIGEACHFVDLAAFFSGALITEVCATGSADEAIILLRTANGDQAVINYLCNGSKQYDKERVELYRAGCTIIIENWRSLRTYGFRKDASKKISQDKGHEALLAAWVQGLSTGQPPFAPDAMLNSSLATIAAVESLQTGSWVRI